jgi:hypothetical protein
MSESSVTINTQKDTTSSKTVILGIQPTIYLKKIDPLNIPQKIINGEYKDMTIETLQSWKKSTKESHQISVIGTNRLDKMFTYTDRNNNVFTCVTTNNFSFPNTICQWCRISFNHTWIGIPYRIEQSQTKTYYYTEGCYCCFECAFAEIESISRKSYVLRSGLLMSPHVLLENLFLTIYPTKHLRPSLPFHYHERNGGAMNDKEYYSNRSQYIETSGIIVMPCKKISVRLG